MIKFYFKSYTKETSKFADGFSRSLRETKTVVFDENGEYFFKEHVYSSSMSKTVKAWIEFYHALPYDFCEEIIHGIPRKIPKNIRDTYDGDSGYGGNLTVSMKEIYWYNPSWGGYTYFPNRREAKKAIREACFSRYKNRENRPKDTDGTPRVSCSVTFSDGTTFEF